jgi:hypothetical protein
VAFSPLRHPLARSLAAPALLALVGGIQLAAPTPASALTMRVHLSDASVLPGHTTLLHGSVPLSCAGRPVTVTQHFLKPNASRGVTPGTPGVVGPDGKFTVTVTVPPQAVRSDIARPYSGPQYDVVEAVVEFCGRRGANINVLPFGHREHITFSPTRPRSGTTMSVTVTHCRGGVLDTFAQVIDRRGAYYQLNGSLKAGTFHGTVDLRHGFFGSSAHTGAARASRNGARDALLRVPCAQSEGNAAAKRREPLQHLNWGVDFTIRRRG